MNSGEKGYSVSDTGTTGCLPEGREVISLSLFTLNKLQIYSLKMHVYPPPALKQYTKRITREIFTKTCVIPSMIQNLEDIDC